MSMVEYEIEKLEAARYCRTLDRQSIDMLLDSAIATIKELSAKVASDNMERSSQYYHDGWIPTSERLPSKRGSYLVSTEPYDCGGGKFSKHAQRAYRRAEKNMRED